MAIGHCHGMETDDSYPIRWNDFRSEYGYAWCNAWANMWRSIGYACERSKWDTLGMWSRPMGA